MLKRFSKIRRRPFARLLKGAGYILFLAAAQLVLVELAALSGGPRRRGPEPAGLRGGEDLRVMCLGDSITYENYPRELDLFLNRELAGRGKRATVIDLARPGDDCEEMAQRLAAELEKNKPDFLVIMSGEIARIHGVRASWLSRMLSRFRLFRLLRLALHRNRMQPPPSMEAREIVINEAESLRTHRELMAELGMESENDCRYVCNPRRATGSYPDGEPIGADWNESLPEDAKIAALCALVQRRPNCFEAGVKLAEIYSSRKEHRKVCGVLGMQKNPDGFCRFLADRDQYFIFLCSMVELRRAAAAADLIACLVPHMKSMTRIMTAYSFLCSNILLMKDPAEAERMHKELVIRYYRNPESYVLACKHYVNTGRRQEARRFAERMLKDFKALPWIYYAEAMLVLGRPVDVHDRTAGLGGVVSQAGYTRIWEDMGEDVVCGIIGVCALNAGRAELARQWFDKAEKIRLEIDCTPIERSYRRIVRLCIENGTVPVVMQYPLHRVEFFRRMLYGCEDEVVFVENFDNFFDAVLEKGYYFCFSDRYRGDYGHPTREGSRMIAENLGRRLLEHCLADGGETG